MFYEANQIHNLLKCPNCKGALQDARLLPCCEETICSLCLETQILDKHKLNKYKCIVCKNTHEMPENRHFASNKFINKVFQERPKEVYRNKECETLRNYFKVFDSNKTTMNRFVDDGTTLIREHCNKLRDEIQTTTDTLMKDLKAGAEKYMHSINKYEIETIEKLSKVKQNDIKKTAKITEEFNNYWIDYMNKPVIDQNEIGRALRQAKQLQEKLSSETHTLKKLVNDGFLMFEVNPSLYDIKEIGTLKYVEKKDQANTFVDSDGNEMSCSHTFEGHREWIRCLKYVPGKKVDRLISGSDDYLIKIWDLESGECLKTLKGHEDSVTCFEWYNDKLISGSWDSNIRVWDINLKQNECVKTLAGHTYRVSNLKVYTNKLISSSWDCQIKIWDLMSGKCLRTLKGHTSVIYCLEIIDDSLISGSVDKSIKCWNIAKCHCAKTLHGHTGGVTDLKALAGDMFLSSSFDSTIKVWSLREAKCLRTLTGHEKGVFCLKLIGNDRMVSGSLDATIKVWNLKTFEVVNTLSGHMDFVLCFELAAHRLISGSADKTIKAWEMD